MSKDAWITMGILMGMFTVIALIGWALTGTDKRK